MSSLCPRSVFGIRGHCVLFHSVRSAFTDHDVGSSLPDCKTLTTHLTITFVGKCIIYMKFYYQDTIMVVSRQTPRSFRVPLLSDSFAVRLCKAATNGKKNCKRTANEAAQKQQTMQQGTANEAAKKRQTKRRRTANDAANEAANEATTKGKRSGNERQATQQMKRQMKRQRSAKNGKRTANEAANEAAKKRQTKLQRTATKRQTNGK